MLYTESFFKLRRKKLLHKILPKNIIQASSVSGEASNMSLEDHVKKKKRHIQASSKTGEA